MFDSLETTPHTNSLTPPLDAVAWRVRLRTGETPPRTLQAAMLARTETEAADVAWKMHFSNQEPGYDVHISVRRIERGCDMSIADRATLETGRRGEERK